MFLIFEILKKSWKFASKGKNVSILLKCYFHYVETKPVQLKRQYLKKFPPTAGYLKGGNLKKFPPAAGYLKGGILKVLKHFCFVVGFLKDDILQIFACGGLFKNSYLKESKITSGRRFFVMAALWKSERAEPFLSEQKPNDDMKNRLCNK